MPAPPAVTDGEQRYRSRHARGLAPRPVAELVMLDADNPRALRYQIESLLEHLARLPGGQPLGEPLRALRAELDAALLCEHLDRLAADPRQPSASAAREAVSALLWRIWHAANTLADDLSHRYFTHLDARSHATASR